MATDGYRPLKEASSRCSFSGHQVNMEKDDDGPPHKGESDDEMSNAHFICSVCSYMAVALTLEHYKSNASITGDEI
ncbi:hypothetical protein OPV22_015482 [Ensete ventricosum]|uniref:Uncharacterized protein n=1 Tax=Ensete ventricosum TaxID=4639 RepID=A0AAV8R8D5_ENSVE|nr:hypothetical protein OPV22_015482 [Ensete ventricosum]